jgi:hypothetical protein
MRTIAKNMQTLAPRHRERNLMAKNAQHTPKPAKPKPSPKAPPHVPFKDRPPPSPNPSKNDQPTPRR